jgi:hypothetical protein
VPTSDPAAVARRPEAGRPSLSVPVVSTSVAVSVAEAVRPASTGPAGDYELSRCPGIRSGSERFRIGGPPWIDAKMAKPPLGPRRTSWIPGEASEPPPLAQWATSAGLP